MMRARPRAVAEVATITECDETWSLVRCLLTDAATSVRRYGTLTAALGARRPDAIVFDRRALGGPTAHFLTVRRQWPTIPLAVLGARDERDIAHLLDAGADEAIIAGSPAAAARLHALARRARTLNGRQALRFGDVRYDSRTGEVWCAGSPVLLSPREERLFYCLFERAPDPVDLETLSEAVWGFALCPALVAELRVYIGHLRKKLATSEATQICTVRGVGYALSLAACEHRRA